MYCKRNIRRAGSPCWSARTLSESSDAGTGPERFWTTSRFWSIRGTEPDSVSDERFTFLKDVPTIPVVATDIRARIRRGENPADDLPPGVWEYIKENGLYGYAR